MITIGEKFQEVSFLLEKEDFLKELNNVTNHEECRRLFEKNGIELSIDDIQFMVEESAKASNQNGELSEEELDNVLGGAVTECFFLSTALFGFFTSYGHRAINEY